MVTSVLNVERVSLETANPKKMEGKLELPDDSGFRSDSAKLPDDSGNEFRNKPFELGKQNKLAGRSRELEVEQELKEKYPEGAGYSVVSEAFLRNESGDFVKDPVTEEARRIDFVVIKDGKVVDSVEVTSKTANKTAQTEKEVRIREKGGNYVRDENGVLVEIPSDVHTRIERRA